MRATYSKLLRYGKSAQLRLAVKLLFSAGLLYLLFGMIEWEQLRAVLQLANVPLLLSGIIFFLVNLSLIVSRWKVALSSLGIEESKSSLFRLNVSGTFYNHFLPSTVGGDAYKLLVLSGVYPTRRKELFASIVADRFSGLVGLLVINVVLVSFFTQYVLASQVFLLFEIGMVLVILLLPVAIVLNKLLIGRMAFGEKVRESLAQLQVLATWPILLRMFAYSVVFVIVGTLWLWTYLFAFGYAVEYVYLLFIFTIVQTAGMVPISFNSIGVAEGLLVFFLGFIGVPPEVALMVALLQRVSLMLLSAAGWFVVTVGPGRNR